MDVAIGVDIRERRAEVGLGDVRAKEWWTTVESATPPGATALYFATIPREGDSLAIERMLSRAALNRAITVAIDTPSKAAISS